MNWPKATFSFSDRRQARGELLKALSHEGVVSFCAACCERSIGSLEIPADGMEDVYLTCRKALDDIWDATLNGREITREVEFPAEDRDFSGSALEAIATDVVSAVEWTYQIFRRVCAIEKAEQVAEWATEVTIEWINISSDSPRLPIGYVPKSDASFARMDEFREWARSHPLLTLELWVQENSLLSLRNPEFDVVSRKLMEEARKTGLSAVLRQVYGMERDTDD